MKKRFLTASIAIILTTATVIPATLQEVHAANETKVVLAQEEHLSAQEFLDLAVTALTFQHGSDSMRQKFKDQWVKAGEISDLSATIKRDQAARILVRAVDKEEK